MGKEVDGSMGPKLGRDQFSETVGEAYHGGPVGPGQMGDSSMRGQKGPGDTRAKAAVHPERRAPAFSPQMG